MRVAAHPQLGLARAAAQRRPRLSPSGDYVFFADNDDYLELDALERLHAMAVTDRADIVIGKVVGHGKRVNRSPFRKNVHGQPFDSVAPARRAHAAQAVPPPLPRRARHPLPRGPAAARGPHVRGPGLLQGGAHLRARRPADLPLGAPRRGVERLLHRFDAEGYFGNVREVLDLVDANTEPGEWREKVKAHWYRGKMLQRVGGRGWLDRDADYREQLYAEVRELALERFDESVHERMAFNLRVRSKLLRAQEAYQPLELLARFETRLRSHVKLRSVIGKGTHVVLKLDAKLGGQLTPLRFERREDGRTLWVPPREAARRDRRGGPRRHRRPAGERGPGVPAERRRRQPVPAALAHARSGSRRQEGRAGARAPAGHDPDRPHRRRRGRSAAARAAGT